MIMNMATNQKGLTGTSKIDADYERVRRDLFDLARARGTPDLRRRDEHLCPGRRQGRHGRSLV